jgi:hypothetical protein
MDIILLIRFGSANPPVRVKDEEFSSHPTWVKFHWHHVIRFGLCRSTSTIHTWSTDINMIFDCILFPLSGSMKNVQICHINNVDVFFNIESSDMLLLHLVTHWQCIFIEKVLFVSAHKSTKCPLFIHFCPLFCGIEHSPFCCFVLFCFVFCVVLCCLMFISGTQNKLCHVLDISQIHPLIKRRKTHFHKKNFVSFNDQYILH